MPRPVELYVQPLGSPRTGAWCDHCALPSVIEVDLVISSKRSTVATSTARMCTECGER